MDRHMIEDEDVRMELASDIDMQAKHDPYKEEMEVESPVELWDSDDEDRPAYDPRAGS